MAIGAVITLALAAIVVHAADNSITDNQIAEIMQTANNAEIDAAKLAKSKATTEQVKTFAEEMMTAHKQNNKDEKDLGKRIDVKAKSNDIAKGLKKDAKVNLADLKKMKGTTFDKAYIKMQISMHQALLNDLDQKFIPAAQNTHFKEYLQTTRAHVAEHLSKAQDVQIDISKN